MDNVIVGQFEGSPFREFGELADALWNAIMEFEHRVPTAGVVGVLRIIEHKLLTEIHDGP